MGRTSPNDLNRPVANALSLQFLLPIRSAIEFELLKGPAAGGTRRISVPHVHEIEPEQGIGCTANLEVTGAPERRSGTPEVRTGKG